MTGNFEQPKHTGARDAWPEASTSLVQADDILMPEEVARLTVSLCSPALCFAEVATLVATGLAQPGLKVPDSWIYEKTRGRCRYLSGSSALAARRGTGLIPFLHLGRYVRLQRPLPYVCQRNAIPCVSPSVGTFHKG